MRLKPQNGEFEKLDSLDEKSIISMSGKLYHQLNDLVSLSYFGMVEIADLNSIQKLSESTDLTGFFLTAKVKILNPRTRWKGYGAAQCDNTLENQAFDVAVKKAFRNAVRLSFPPCYLRKCLKKMIGGNNGNGKLEIQR